MHAMHMHVRRDTAAMWRTAWCCIAAFAVLTMPHAPGRLAGPLLVDGSTVDKHDCGVLGQIESFMAVRELCREESANAMNKVLPALRAGQLARALHHTQLVLSNLLSVPARNNATRELINGVGIQHRHPTA